jgi:hypothetical protein
MGPRTTGTSEDAEPDTGEAAEAGDKAVRSSATIANVIVITKHPAMVACFLVMTHLSPSGLIAV